MFTSDFLTRENLKVQVAENSDKSTSKSHNFLSSFLSAAVLVILPQTRFDLGQEFVDRRTVLLGVLIQTLSEVVSDIFVTYMDVEGAIIT